MKKTGKLFFQSYDNTIAIYDRNTQTLKLGEAWDYSKTTLRHLYLFIEDVTFFNLPEKNRKKHIEKTNCRWHNKISGGFVIMKEILRKN